MCDHILNLFANGQNATRFAGRFCISFLPFDFISEFRLQLCFLGLLRMLKLVLHLHHNDSFHFSCTNANTLTALGFCIGNP